MTEPAVRVRWLVGTVHSVRSETATARSIVLDVPGWPGHLAGQHVDLRLTAPDGYQAVRSYSLAAPADGQRVELTVQLIEDGEVSPYLVDVVLPTEQVELRGPVGGWFSWDPDRPGPVLLVAGGSGIVPLMAMVRARAAAASTAPFTLVYSVRGPAQRYYAEELDRVDGLDLRMVHTREAGPNGRPPGRIGPADLDVALGARVYVCGPTGFVDAAIALLLAAGHDAADIRSERFGGQP
ncbi:oxidoreductase [Actinophytocola xinjiangensis]|uniref:Oxidoreductase n=1 Tax=Actinophytocola xinjiangensis TaxID=485602 RepID=A0A7Z0WIN5_9PSEU|nr:FAD-binding oxidoreductase [Actinophytocola xinjiangensis]OLF08153.1 oxidoreductase [Actinophytocola xinjiangensis]